MKKKMKNNKKKSKVFREGVVCSLWNEQILYCSITSCILRTSGHFGAWATKNMCNLFDLNDNLTLISDSIYSYTCFNFFSEISHNGKTNLFVRIRYYDDLYKKKAKKCLLVRRCGGPIEQNAHYIESVCIANYVIPSNIAINFVYMLIFAIFKFDSINK